MLHLLFCDNFLHPRDPDEVYAAEFAAALDCGFSCGLVSFVEQLATPIVEKVVGIERDVRRALRG